MMGVESSKLRDSARGQNCTFNTPFCNYDPNTVVLCHIRDDVTGRSTKANDYSSAFGCHACHDAIDQHRLPREDELFYSLRALQRTMRIWVASGLISVPETRSLPKPLSKIAARRHIASGESF